MKNLVFISIFFVLSLSFVYAQAPQGLNYQAIGRNLSGTVLPNQAIGVKFTIINNSPTGTSLYSEQHSITTNAAGLFTLVIGTGNNTTGNFNTINWGAGNKYLKTEIDPTGGTSYTISNTSQMQSVPYALYAEKTSLTAGNGISISGNTITNTSPNQTVSLTAGPNITVTGAYPNFTIAGTGGGGSNYWTALGTDIYNNNAGFVGIGAAAPESKLDVTTNVYGPNNLAIISANYTGTTADDAIGVYGNAVPQDYWGIGVAGAGGFIGVAGQVAPTGGDDYYGVTGNVSGGTGMNFGVAGAADGTGTNYGVYGYSDNAGTAGVSVDGAGLLFAEDPFGNTMANGVYGNAQGAATAVETNGVFGSSTASGESYSTGVYGIGFNGTINNYGIYGYSDGGGTNDYAVGVYGHIGTTPSVLGNYAGYFYGDLTTTGTLAKAGGTFKIDHPLDPANKYLYHSFVESPDMLNIYKGHAITDNNGMAIVALPSYFETENMDFEYQLTCIGQFAQVIILEKVQNNQFTIQSDKPNVEVSWQVTGVRNDKWAQAHRVVPEVEKKGIEKGKYLHPELYGQPHTSSIGSLVGADRGKNIVSSKEATKAIMPKGKK